MDSASDIKTDDTRAEEIGIIVHEGREFASGGFSIDLEHGRMVAYVKATLEGYILQTWEGQTLARLKRTDNHPRMLQGYYGHRLSRGPMGFNGTRLESFRTLDPIAGYHWYGRGLGAGCALKLRRGRKA